MLLSNICYQFPQPISCIIIVVVIITPLPSSYDEKQNSEGKNKFHTPLCPVPKTHKTENRPPQKNKIGDSRKHTTKLQSTTAIVEEFEAAAGACSRQKRC
jgi:hypothetical protein